MVRGGNHCLYRRFLPGFPFRGEISSDLGACVIEPRQLAQAKSRLKLCLRAFNELKDCHFEQEEFQTHWQDFLTQWKGTYMKIQQAAKSTPQELQWFGGINALRRKDPLLRWLYEARNDEEHYGLIDSATQKPGEFQIRILKDGPFTAIHRLNADGSLEVFDKYTGEVVGEVIKHEPEVAKLQEVTQRDGKKVPPPTEHLDNPFKPVPKMAACLGLWWLGQLFAKADAMSKSKI